MITVLMIAGIMEEFSVVYFHANRPRFKLEIPFTRIYTTRETTSAAVISAEIKTRISRIRDPGFFLYEANFWRNVLLFIIVLAILLILPLN